jgi:hypothetical protein
MHAAGKPIRVIAKKLGLTYDSVKGLQDRFKLPTITDVESKRQGVKTQLRRLGLKSLAELRSRAHKKFVLENGWPAEWQLRVREVQILNFLIAHGPSTARQIAEAIGANTDRAFRTGYPRRVLLTDSGRDGTYTASLLKKNLIIRTERRAKGAPARRLPCLYHPSAETIAYFEEHHGSNTHSQPA